MNNLFHPLRIFLYFLSVSHISILSQILFYLKIGININLIINFYFAVITKRAHPGFLLWVQTLLYKNLLNLN